MKVPTYNLFNTLNSMEQSTSLESFEPPRKRRYLGARSASGVYLTTKTGLPFLLMRPNSAENRGFRDIYREKGSGHLIPKDRSGTDINANGDDDCFHVSLYRGTNVMNQRYYHICRIQNIDDEMKIIPSFKDITYIIRRWQKVVHPNLAPIYDAFYTTAFNDIEHEQDLKGSFVIIYEYDSDSGLRQDISKDLMDYAAQFSLLLQTVHDEGLRLSLTDVLENVPRVRNYPTKEDSATGVRVRLLGAGLTDVLDYLRLFRGRRNTRQKTVVRDRVSLARFLKLVSIHCVRPCCHLLMSNVLSEPLDEHFCDFKSFCDVLRVLENGKIPLKAISFTIVNEIDLTADTPELAAKKSRMLADCYRWENILCLLIKVRTVYAHLERNPELIKVVPDAYLVKAIKEYMFPHPSDDVFTRRYQNRIIRTLSLLERRHSKLITVMKGETHIYPSFADVARAIDATFAVLFFNYFKFSDSTQNIAFFENEII